MQHKRASADGENRLASFALSGNELKELGVRDFNSGSLPTRYKQVVQRRTVFEGDVRVDREALRASDWSGMLRDNEALWPTCYLLPHSEHFPRPNEVEFLDVGEDEYSEGHGVLREVYWDA